MRGERARSEPIFTGMHRAGCVGMPALRRALLLVPILASCSAVMAAPPPRATADQPPPSCEETAVAVAADAVGVIAFGALATSLAVSGNTCRETSSICLDVRPLAVVPGAFAVMDLGSGVYGGWVLSQCLEQRRSWHEQRAREAASSTGVRSVRLERTHRTSSDETSAAGSSQRCQRAATGASTSAPLGDDGAPCDSPNSPSVD